MFLIHRGQPFGSPGLAAALLLASGMAAAEDAVRSLPVPAGPESGQYALMAGEEGTILLSWIEPSEGGHAFRFSELLEEGWGEPGTVTEGAHLFVNWADHPAMVVIGGDRLAAHWLVKNPDSEGDYGYGIRMAHSFDRGETWREVFAAGLGKAASYTGFMSYALEPGGFSGAYLTPKPGTAGEVMTLRVARFHIDGHPLGDQLLDDDACNCCPLGMTTSSLGPLVVYRDRQPASPDDDVRDIAVRRRVREVWEPGRLVHADGWRIDGCPVNGPAAAAAGNAVAVAWFTLATGEPEMRVAFSGNAAGGFAPPTRFDEGSPRGWPDIVLLDDGTAAILWLEAGEGGRGEVRLRRMTPDGLPSESLLIAEAPAGRDAGMLQMERRDDRLIIAWRDGGVRAASVDIAALTRP